MPKYRATLLFDFEVEADDSDEAERHARYAIEDIIDQDAYEIQLQELCECQDCKRRTSSIRQVLVLPEYNNTPYTLGAQGDAPPEHTPDTAKIRRQVLV